MNTTYTSKMRCGTHAISSLLDTRSLPTSSARVRNLAGTVRRRCYRRTITFRSYPTPKFRFGSAQLPHHDLSQDSLVPSRRRQLSDPAYPTSRCHCCVSTRLCSSVYLAPRRTETSTQSIEACCSTKRSHTPSPPPSLESQKEAPSKLDARLR